MVTAAVQEFQVERKAERFYRPELDILRFLAFSMVFLAHSNWGHWWAVWGILGVPVFFLLSAFLITDLLLREKEATGAIHIRSFYIRRILRIWPLYFAALLLGFLFVSFLDPHYRWGYKDFAAYFLLAGNWGAAAHGYLPAGMGPLWSIAVEEQFYLIWPLCVRSLGRRGILRLAVLLWIASQISVAILWFWKIPLEPGIWCNTFADLQYFALGAAFSAILRGRLPTVPRLGRWVLAMSGFAVFVLCGPVVTGSYAPFTDFGALCMPMANIGAVLLFFSLIGARLPRITKPVVTLGKMSYGLYVMHLWVWVLVGAVISTMPGPSLIVVPERYLMTFLILFSVTVLSYNYFEKPFLRLKTRFEYVASRPV